MIKRMIYNSMFVVLIATIVTQCQPQKSKGEFTVNVKYKNLDKMVASGKADRPGQDPATSNSIHRILLEEIPYGGDMNPIILDSATLTGKDGSVTLKGNGKGEAIFQLAGENGPLVLLINDSEIINVEIDFGKSDSYYSVNGSEASSMLKDFLSQYSERTFHVNKAFADLDSLKQSAASDSIVIKSTEKKNASLKELNNYLESFIRKSEHPALSLFALGWLSRSLPQAEFEKSLNDVVKKFPEHEVLGKLKVTYDAQKAQLADQQEKKAESVWVGKSAPELSLPTAEGKVVSLSSFRGKYLLVDFWASWCAPCRHENPNVVKAYNQFKDKNFDILGVSLDKDKQAWLKGIQDDQLAWTHVSDLKHWSSKAAEIYHIEGIPYNVLIDPQGVIIAENLRGFDLEKTLSEVLK